MIKRMTNDEFIKRVMEEVGEEYTFLEDYQKSNLPIEVIHNVCGYKYKCSANNFLNGGKRCPQCANNIKGNSRSLQAKVDEVHGKDVYTVLGDYVNRQTKLLVRHEICKHEYYVTPCNITKGKKCPHCNRLNNESEGIKKIKRFLRDQNIKFVIEKTFDDLRDKNPLRFDIFIPTLNTVIEFDGLQHFKPSYGSSLEERIETLNNTRRRDAVKNKYCSDNGIKMIRIPYHQEHQVESILESLLLEKVQRLSPSGSTIQAYWKEEALFYYNVD